MEKEKLINTIDEICNDGIQIDMEKWKENRRKSLYVFLFSNFILGMDFVLMSGTLLSYLSEKHVDQPALLYGLISAGGRANVLVFGKCFSTLFDKHRRMRLAYMSIKGVGVVGYFIYLLPVSPWINSVGAFIIGTGSLMDMLMNSEILRVYDTDEIQEKLLYSMMGWSLGEIIGSLVLPWFEKVNLMFMGYHIVPGNAYSLVLLCLTLINMVVIYFFLHDLSRAFDLKEHRTKMKRERSFKEKIKERANKRSLYTPNLKTTSELLQLDEKDHNRDSFLDKEWESFSTITEYKQPADTTIDELYLQDNVNAKKLDSLKSKEIPITECSLFEMLRSLHYDAVLLLTQQFYTGFVIPSLIRMIPLIMYDLHYNALGISMSYLTFSISAVILTFILMKVDLSSTQIYYSGIASLVFIWFQLVIIMFFRHRFNDAVNYTLIFVFSISHALSWIVDNTFLVGTFGKLFPSSIQTSMECIRMFVRCLGALIGALTCAYVYKYSMYVFPLFFIANGLFMILLETI